jgi:PleD family two-component response regulator
MPLTDGSFNDAIKRADLALYQANAAWRNCIAVAPIFAVSVA